MPKLLNVELPKIDKRSAVLADRLKKKYGHLLTMASLIVLSEIENDESVLEKINTLTAAQLATVAVILGHELDRVGKKNKNKNGTRKRA